MTHLSHDHKLRFLIRISLFHNHTSDFSFDDDLITGVNRRSDPHELQR